MIKQVKVNMTTRMRTKDISSCSNLNSIRTKELLLNKVVINDEILM